MKKISYIIFLAVIIGIGTISLWIYVKYFNGSEQKILTLPVVQKDITESVKVRGKIASKTEFDLGFAESGTIGKIFVSSGQIVKANEPIIRLDLKEKESEAKSLEAVLAGKKAGLAKLLAGYTKEDIAVYETKVKNAEIVLSDAQKNLLDLLNEAYTVSDNSIHNYADSMISNPRTNFPQLSFNTTNGSLKNSIESGRVNMEKILTDLGQFTGSISDIDPQTAGITANDYLEKIRSFLDLLASAVNQAQVNSSISATSIDSWKTDIATARTNINTVISDLTGAEEKWKGAKSALELAQKELLLKQAGSRSEDLALSESDIAKAESDLSAMRDKIARSTIYAPLDGIIKKIWLEKSEVASAGETAISFSALGSQVEADISELDIVKINPGQPAEIAFDAFPGQNFSGKVISIDPEELDKDGDTYYRVNFSIDSPSVKIRPGMSSDIKVDTETKTGVLSASNLAIYKQNGKEYAKVLKNGETEEVEITTGIRNGESVEIISGLNLGDEVIISAD